MSDASAATLEVAPVVIELSSGTRAAVMTITNHDPDAVYVQIRGLSWTQDQRDDKLVATDDLILAPPIFQLPNGASQVVRVVLQRDPGAEERTYRLLVDQVPTAVKQSGVQFALRLSIPVFVEPDQAIAAHLTAHIGSDGRDGNALFIDNAGTKRIRLFKVALHAGTAEVKLTAPANPYILAGISRIWAISGSLPRNSGLTVSAQTDDGPISLPVSGP